MYNVAYVTMWLFVSLTESGLRVLRETIFVDGVRGDQVAGIDQSASARVHPLVDGFTVEVTAQTAVLVLLQPGR